MPSTRLHVACLHPEIPQNTGNIGRICVGLGMHLHLVHPLGFSVSQKAVRRAGVDHWKKVHLTEHADLNRFLSWAHGRRIHMFSRHGHRPYTSIRFRKGDVLVFGRESVGLPQFLLDQYGAFFLPTPGPIRSLNLSNTVAVVSYAAMLQIEPGLFKVSG